MLYEADDDSKAAEQAKALGLTHAGYGYWHDETGQAVARTIKGHLVKLSPNERELASWQQDRQDDGLPYMSFDDEPAQDDLPYMSFDDEPSTATDLPFIDFDDPNKQPHDPRQYQAPDWYASSVAELSSELASALADTKLYSSEQVISAITSVLNVDPTITYTTNSPDLKEFEKRTGLRAHGLFNTRTRQVHLSDKVSFGLDVGTYSVKTLRDQYDAARREKNGLFQEIGRSIHTVIHESIHAKDPAMDDVANGNVDSVTSYQFTYLTEGLTEYKSRAIMGAMFDGIYQEKIVTELSYNKEVAAIHALATLDKSVPDALWSMTTQRDRVDYLDQSVMPALQNTWRNRTDKNKFSSDEASKIDKFLDNLNASLGGVNFYMHPSFVDVAHLIVNGLPQDFDDILTQDEDMNYFYNKG